MDPVKGARSDIDDRMGCGCEAGGCSILFGIMIATLMFGYQVFMGLTSNDWIRTPCNIISSKVETTKRSRSGSRLYSHKPIIEYEYVFENNKFRSKAYNFDLYSTGNPGIPEQIVARYPPGRITHCYVNPGNPKRAVLVKEMFLDEGILILLVISLVIVGIGVTFILLAFSAARERKKMGSLDINNDC